MNSEKYNRHTGEELNPFWQGWVTSGFCTLCFLHDMGQLIHILTLKHTWMYIFS